MEEEIRAECSTAESSISTVTIKHSDESSDFPAEKEDSPTDRVEKLLKKYKVGMAEVSSPWLLAVCC